MAPVAAHDPPLLRGVLRQEADERDARSTRARALAVPVEGELDEVTVRDAQAEEVAAHTRAPAAVPERNDDQLPVECEVERGEPRVEEPRPPARGRVDEVE